MTRWIVVTLLALVACGGAEFTTGPGDGGAGDLVTADTGAQGDDAGRDAQGDGAVDAASIEAACTTTAHGNGVGESYESCGPDTYASATAMAACQAYALTIHDDAGYCGDGWNCNTDASTSTAVCYEPRAGACSAYCWVYVGTDVGVVSGCTCPWTQKATW
jgi:hypothetical protein